MTGYTPDGCEHRAFLEVFAKHGSKELFDQLRMPEFIARLAQESAKKNKPDGIARGGRPGGMTKRQLIRPYDRRM